MNAPGLDGLLDDLEDDFVLDDSKAYAPMCCLCSAEGELVDAGCAEKPERYAGTALGMYHCPDCGAMVLAGLPHPQVCKECRK